MGSIVDTHGKDYRRGFRPPDPKANIPLMFKSSDTVSLDSTVEGVDTNASLPESDPIFFATVPESSKTPKIHHDASRRGVPGLPSKNEHRIAGQTKSTCKRKLSLNLTSHHIAHPPFLQDRPRVSFTNVPPVVNSNRSLQNQSASLPDRAVLDCCSALPLNPEKGKYSIGLIFSEFTPEKLSDIQCTGDQLLPRDLAEVLEKYSTTWGSAGFSNIPLTSTLAPQNVLSVDLYAKLFRNVGLNREENGADCVKLRLARVSLYLHYIREVESKLRDGVEGSQVKNEAINGLLGKIELAELGASPLNPDKKGKIQKAFYAHKRLAERWWWLAISTSLGTLLVCSEEIGNKVDNPDFPINALVVYILQNLTDDIAVCRAFENVVRRLLITGRHFPIFTQAEVQNLINRLKESHEVASAPALPDWHPFDADSAACSALPFLHEQADNPQNRPVKCSRPWEL